ncbi:MAG: ribosome recycling factor [Candidatus Zambryskibacteria bacterium CG10_big_fil_rev_8_21_14_0_10_42_12]|uniref:Ribosome-recycling factor n=1 Tax=Candidatus Zambryskibacteria bacterium CG10_big_fil_rev_8_21_14_0_10_42_12 TaxID=1975115 RepID=A0A2H0QUF4_9BACT|nr:MAG: ribosome recycling factor [Candidatus Zambryskibacteria bacterium CG10_big_fil_rev_8_21_14_0_10_42_12]
MQNMYDFKPFQKSIADIKEWLRAEFGTVRTGRANPAVLDRVQIEAYGSRMSIKELATVSVEDARTIRVAPWDNSQIKAIEKAITEAELGLSIVTDEKGLRLIFPELTGERRDQLVKVVKDKHEDARVRLKNERQKVVDDIEKKEKTGDLSEDDKFRLKDEVQKMIDAAHADFERMFEEKEKDIKTV